MAFLFWRGIGSFEPLFFPFCYRITWHALVLYVLGIVGSIELHTVRMLYMIPFCF